MSTVENNYQHNHILPIGQYPFFDFGKEILKSHGMSIGEIDDTPVYNSIIADVLNDIIDSFKHNKIIGQDKMRDNRYEVIRFYLTLFILKSMPSRLMYRYWIKAYMNRFEDIIKNLKDLQIISTIFNELKMPHKFLRLEGLVMMAIKINDYLDFAVEVNMNDKRFAHLLLVNMPVHKGRVFIPIQDLNDFKLIIIKLVEIRIYALLEELDLQVRSQKIDRAVEQLQGYIVKDPNSNRKLKQQLEYGEVTPEMQIQNDKIVQMFKAKPGEIDVAQFPPCVNRLLNKILNKQILGHPENILLAAYLASKGYSKEQMIDIFMLAPNADKGKIDYNLGYIFEKQLKPYNCNKADEYHLCYKDQYCIKYQLTSPMGYRK